MGSSAHMEQLLPQPLSSCAAQDPPRQGDACTGVVHVRLGASTCPLRASVSSSDCEVGISMLTSSG